MSTLASCLPWGPSSSMRGTCALRACAAALLHAVQICTTWQVAGCVSPATGTNGDGVLLSGSSGPSEVVIPRLLSSDGALNQPMFVQRPPAPSPSSWGTELEMYTLQYIPDPLYYRYGLYCALSADGGASFGPSTLVLRLPNASSSVRVPAGDSLIYMSPSAAAVDLHRRTLHVAILTTSEHSEYSVAVAYTTATNWPPKEKELPMFSSGVLSQAIPAGTSPKTGAAPRNLLVLTTGRLIFPWFYPNGLNYSGADLFNATAIYCDECGSGPASGMAFARAATQLTIPVRAPCESCDGAIEPTIAELPNGTLWMLIRSQTGSLWQSHSRDHGTYWSTATPTNFISSDSPPSLTKLPDGKLLLLYNNALKAFPSPNRSDYPSRQILHAALGTCTQDECRFSGFREVWRDKLLHTAAAEHDYGTAYPYASTYIRKDCADVLIDGAPWHDASGSKYDCAWYKANGRCDNGSTPGDSWRNYTASTACCHCPAGGTTHQSPGNVIVTTGQGLFRTVVLSVPDVVPWLTEKVQTADFTTPSLFWNDTMNFDGSFMVSCTGDFFEDHGAQVPVRPCESSTTLVHELGPGGCGVGRPTALAVGGDRGANGGGGVTWNFPAARVGTLSLELSCEPGWAGGALSLTDFFASPSECQQMADAYHTTVGCEIDQLNVETHGLFLLPLLQQQEQEQEQQQEQQQQQQQQQQEEEEVGVELSPGQYTSVKLQWNLSHGTCQVDVMPAGGVSHVKPKSHVLKQLPSQADRRYSGHASYLRLRTVGSQGRLLVRQISARSVVGDVPTRLSLSERTNPSATKASEEQTEMAPTRSTECDGELLYNNICLPEEWPPKTPATDFVHDVHAAWDPYDPPYLHKPPAVIDISVGRQLFVDSFLIENMTGASIEYFRPKFISPVLTPDREWETNPSSPYPSSPYAKAFSGGVFYNPQLAIHQMWYNCGWGGGLCYATSRDGLQWEKPSLGIIKNEAIGLPGWNTTVRGDSNIVLMNDPGRNRWGGTWDSHVTIDGSTVMVDLEDPDRCSRYKLATVGRAGLAGSQYAFWASPDGVNWTMVTNSSTVIGDRSTFFHNPFRRKWIYSIKINGSPWGRHRFYRETDNVFAGTHWNASDAVLWAHADRLDPPFIGSDGVALPPRGSGPTCPDSSSSSFNASFCAAELYNLDAAPIESLMVGFFSIFQGMGNIDRSGRYEHDEYNSVHLGFSRDGFHWFRPVSGNLENLTICDHCSVPQRVLRREPFISFNRSTLRRCSASQPEQCKWNSYNVQSVGGGLIVANDSFRFYFSADSGNNVGNGQQGNSSTGVAELRRDGFAAIRCVDPRAGCTVTSRALIAAGRRRLFVNANATAGALRVVVLDAETQTVLPGYGKLDSIPLVSEDSTRAALHWKGSPDLPLGEYRLQFVLEGHAQLFSFWAAADACGASNGFVAAGGPDLGSPRDTHGSCAAKL